MAKFRFSEIELDRLMPDDITSLSRSQPFEPRAIAVDDVDPVADFREPEIEIGELSRQLMSIQRGDFGELIGKSVSDFNRISECLVSNPV